MENSSPVEIFCKISDDTVDVTPCKNNANSVGYELQYCGKTITVPTLMMNSNDHVANLNVGISVCLPRDIHAKIIPIHRLSREGIFVVDNVIDSDSTAEIEIVIINLSGFSRTFKKGEKIAQILFEYTHNIPIRFSQVETF